ncbi:hypothetical protein GCWU000342_00902 [Shuttleworthella satelles DSM 14600]|uniref:Uncharacterized protein n=1 Tax=Shuttleworthella satelles DSM 14600 TaxID=626523 RepID=C4GAF2_9FIRM|nr:hypothetical protein GCWU000342_00902 [Shuttleworthia satelles DSM 14600]
MAVVENLCIHLLNPPCSNGMYPLRASHCPESEWQLPLSYRMGREIDNHTEKSVLTGIRFIP